MSHRVPVLFLAALLGVLACVGLVVLRLAGAVPLVAYTVVVLVLLLVGGARARAAQERSRRAAGRTCTCCTTSTHDPVKVL